MSKWYKGQKVRIGRHKRKLVRRIRNIPGAWEIDKSVDGFRFWNQDDMKPVKAKDQ